MRRLPWVLPSFFGIGLLVGAGCTGSISGLINNTEPDGGPSSSTTGSGGTTGPTGAGGDSGSSSTANLGIPCEVQQVLVARCQGCHSNPPVAGAPMPLMNLADLRAPAKSNPLVTVAQMVSVRINSTTVPMPPKSVVPATAAEIKIVTDWVAGGAQAGLVCGASIGGGTGGGSTGTTTNSGSARCRWRHRRDRDGGLDRHDGQQWTAVQRPGDLAGELPALSLESAEQKRRADAAHDLVGSDVPKSLADSSATFAQRAVIRIQNTAAPMPPVGNPPLSAADVGTIVSWVGANASMGTCGMTTTGAGGGSPITGAGGASAGTGGAGGSTTTTTASGVPCNVRAVFQKWCLGCHTDPPQNGAPMSLISYANLTAKSFADPNATFAQRAISRMTNTATPMPPGVAPVVPAADVATIMSWVSTNYPMATTTCATTGTGGATGAGGMTGGGVGGRTGTGGAGGSTTTVANGIPCDVATLLQNRCVGCHQNPPINGAPMPLVTYANLTAPSLANAAQTFAQPRSWPSRACRAIRRRCRRRRTRRPRPPPSRRRGATGSTRTNRWAPACRQRRALGAPPARVGRAREEQPAPVAQVGGRLQDCPAMCRRSSRPTARLVTRRCRTAARRCRWSRART